MMALLIVIVSNWNSHTGAWREKEQIKASHLEMLYSWFTHWFLASTDFVFLSPVPERGIANVKSEFEKENEKKKWGWVRLGWKENGCD